MIWQKMAAFIKRDFSTNISYRLSFFFQFSGIFFSVVTFYFIAKLFGKAATPYLESYGGDYFSFVLIGIAFSDYLGVGLSSFAGTIREGQMLALFSVVLLPLSIYAFKLGVRKAKKEGSLTHY